MSVARFEFLSAGKHNVDPPRGRPRWGPRADYFAAGTLVVWDVDLLADTVVKVYRASDPNGLRGYRQGEAAEAEPALAGWRMPIDDLFE